MFNASIDDQLTEQKRAITSGLPHPAQTVSGQLPSCSSDAVSGSTTAALCSHRRGSTLAFPAAKATTAAVHHSTIVLHPRSIDEDSNSTVLLVSSSTSRHPHTLVSKSKVSLGQRSSVNFKHHQHPWTGVLPSHHTPKPCCSRSISSSVVAACLPLLSELFEGFGGLLSRTSRTRTSWRKRHSHTCDSSSSTLGMAPTAEVQAAAVDSPALTWRALAAGLGVGAVLCFSNMYFGLQTGWVTMGSMQSAILGYGVFQGLSAAGAISRHLSVAENVIVQTTSVATATMPLAAGLVGIIPALGLLRPEENPPTGPISFTSLQLLAWCTAMAFFGVFVAVPLRYQTIIKEKLRFPSGTATASVIQTLHGVNSSNQDLQQQPQSTQQVGMQSQAVADMEMAVDSAPQADSLAQQQQQQQQAQQWARALRLLLVVFAVSGMYSLAAAWVSWLRVLPIFDWLGLHAATAWGWVLQPSVGYIGQGMIMGPKTACSMMAGAVTGWAILGPVAKARGWASGPIKSIETGAAGWLMWVGLALLLGDCFSELGLLVVQTACEKARRQGVGSRLRKGHRRLNGRTDSIGLLGGARRAGYRRLTESATGHGLSAPGFKGQGLSTPGLEGAGQTTAAPTGAACLELSPSSSVGALEGCEAGSLVYEASAQHQEHQEQQEQQPQEGDGLLPHPGSVGRPTSAATSSCLGTGTDADDDNYEAEEDKDHSGSRDRDSWLLSSKFWIPGLLLSTLLSTSILSPLMGMPVHEPLIAVVLALLVALLAVRALGQTDLNPVSGVGKISQLVFAVVSPGAVVPNLVAGAIAEAGAQQAGDLMQDFKTAHLLGVPPSSQLVAMLLGSAASIPLSVAAFLLYTSAWEVPGPVLQAPMAQIWLDMAKLVNGGKLPDHVGPFCAAAAAIAALLPPLQHLLLHMKQQRHARHASLEAEQVDDLGPRSQLCMRPNQVLPPDIPDCPSFYSSCTADDAEKRHRSCISKLRSSVQQAMFRLQQACKSYSAIDWVLALMPSGVGFAVGMYLTPNWTIPRLVGSLGEQFWLLLSPGSHATFMMVTASGLVLGEGCASIVTAVLQAATA